MLQKSQAGMSKMVKKHRKVDCGGRGKRMTNIENLKAMNVEEMTEFLQDWAMKFLMGKSPINVKA